MQREFHVIFGTGPAGAALARALVKRGQGVRLINRSGRRPQGLPEAAEIVAADLTDPAQAQAAASGASVLYQCASPRYHQWQTEFPPLQAAILRVAQATGARLVALENLYMYGTVDGPMTEDLPYRATSRKGQVRAAMAEQLMQAHEAGRVNVTIGRAADFYGPGVTESALGAIIFRPLLQGRTIWAMGDPDLPHSYNYIEDVGEGLATLGQNPSAAGQIWHLPCAPVTSTRALIARAAEEVGTAPKVRSLGALALRMGGLFTPNAREMVEMLYQFERPFVLDDSKFRRAFGTEATPFATGIPETLDWYRSQG